MLKFKKGVIVKFNYDLVKSTSKQLTYEVIGVNELQTRGRINEI